MIPARALLNLRVEGSWQVPTLVVAEAEERGGGQRVFRLSSPQHGQIDLGMPGRARDGFVWCRCTA